VLLFRFRCNVQTRFPFLLLSQLLRHTKTRSGKFAHIPSPRHPPSIHILPRIRIQLALVAAGRAKAGRQTGGEHQAAPSGGWRKRRALPNVGGGIRRKQRHTSPSIQECHRQNILFVA
jgi:hypothetical protein